MLLSLKVKIHVRPLSGRLAAEREARASLFSDASDERGFNYFRAVDTGRRAVRPVAAKALRFPDPRGVPFTRMAGETSSMKSNRGVATRSGFVFTKFARSFPGWDLSARALRSSSFEIDSLIARYSEGFSGLAELARRIISVLTFHIVRITPKRSGKLARGYRIVSQ